jgi:hypothetical protein
MARSNSLCLSQPSIFPFHEFYHTGRASNSPMNGISFTIYHHHRLHAVSLSPLLRAPTTTHGCRCEEDKQGRPCPRLGPRHELQLNVRVRRGSANSL